MVLSFLSLSHAADPVVSNVCASQREGTKLVDIRYDVSDADGDRLDVTVAVSTNDGAAFDLPASSFSGGTPNGYGSGVIPGRNRHIVWNAGADWNGRISDRVRFRVTANGPPVEWSKTSNMNTLPGNDGWTLAGGPFAAESVSGGILHLVDDNNPEKECIQYWDYLPNHRDGITIEMRLRVNSKGSEPWGNDLTYSDSQSYRQLNFMPSGIREHHGSQTLWSGSLSDGFHSVWVTFARDGMTSLWVDGDDIGDFALPLVGTDYGYSLWWGCGNWNATGDWEVDYIRYTTAGAFAPPEHSADSASTEVDTRDRDRPMVAIASRFCNASRRAVFLENVAFEAEFTVEIEWNGKTKDRIIFRKNGKPFQSGPSETVTIDFAGWSHGDRLSVVAVADDGTESAPVTANFLVAPVPEMMTALSVAGLGFDVKAEGSAVEFTLRVPLSVEFFEKETTAPSEVVGSAKDGKTDISTLGFRVKSGIEGSIRSDGTLTLDMHYNAKPWKAFGVEFEPSIHGGLHGSYAGTADWSVGGQAGFDVQASASSPPFYIWHIPPIYARIKLSGGVGVEGDIAYESAKTPPLQWDVVIPVHFMISLVGGLGVADVIGIEGELGGGLGLEAALPHDPVLRKLDLIWKLTLRGYVSVLEWEICSIDGEYDLLNKSRRHALGLRGETTALALDAALKRPRMAPFTLSARDYLAKRDSRSRHSVRPAGAPAATLVEASVFPRPRPCLAWADRKLKWTRLRDAVGRASADRLALVAQTRSGGSWSAPVPIWDDGTLDGSPDMAADGTRLVAAWQNANTLFGESVTNLSEVLPFLEIAAGVFDGTNWTAANLTTNGALDLAPCVAATDGRALVAWTHNASNSLSGASDLPNDLMCSAHDGGVWSPPAAIATNVGMILWRDLAFDGSNGVFVCCRDMDDDSATVTNQEIFAATFDGGTWSTLTRRTDNAVQDTNPRVAYDGHGKLIVTWFRNGQLMTDDDLDFADAVAAGDMVDTSEATDYRLVAGPEGQVSVLWEQLDGNQESNPHMLSFDPLLRTWSAPVALLNDTNRLEGAFSGCFSPSGTLCLAYTSAEITMDTNDVPRLGQVDLHVLEQPLNVDLAVGDDGIALSDLTPAPGETVTVSFVAYNLGPVSVGNAAWALYAGAPGAGGTAVASNTIPLLEGGGSTNIACAWQAPESTTPVELVVVLDPALVVSNEANRANNSSRRFAMEADVAASDFVAVRTAEDKWVLSVRAENTGSLPLTNALAVAFRRGGMQGPVLGQTDVHPKKPGSAYDAAIEWDTAGVTFTSAFERIYAVVDAGNAVNEADENDNAELTVIMTTLDSDSDGLLDGDELACGSRTDVPDTDGDGLDDGDEVHVHGTSPTAADTDGDGADDGHELAAGTDPHSATDVFRIVSAEGVTNYQMCVRWNAKSGATYRVEITEGLQGGGWANAPNGVGPEERCEQTAVSNGVLRHRDTTAVPPTNRFYRVRLLP